MRRRLLLVLAVIGAVALTGFAVPLALSVAEARTRQFVLQRESDASRFATLATDYVQTGDDARVASEGQAYLSTYGDDVLVVSTRGIPDLSFGMDVDPAVEAAIRRGLRNERGSDLTRLTPFSDSTALFVKPVGSGAQVNGVVVIRASTADVRADVTRSWAAIAVGWLIALTSFGALAVLLSRWILKPLVSLSAGMERLAFQLPLAPDEFDESGDVMPTRHAGPPEIRRLAQTFDALVATVLRSIESQRRLVADASHQLRNPLAALQFRLDLLEDAIPADAEDDFHMVSREATRLHTILDGLLSLASAETPTPLGLDVGDGTCGVDVVAADRVDFWATVAADRGARLSYDNTIGYSRARAHISESSLSQIVDVLIDNATRHAGDHPTITVSTREVDGRIEIEVADDGPGVPAGDLTKVLQRFYTTGEGSGLGLPIVDVLVRGAGGRLLLGTSQAGGMSVRVVVEPADVVADDEASAR